MSPRTRPTFAKRQKEQARQEKQRMKAQRKAQRKLDSQAQPEGVEVDQFGQNPGESDPTMDTPDDSETPERSAESSTP